MPVPEALPVLVKRRCNKPVVCKTDYLSVQIVYTMRPLALLLVMLCLGAGVQAQISFTRADNTITKGFRSGCAVVSIDVNGDSNDDLVRLNRGRDIRVDLQGVGGEFITVFQATVSNNPEWNLVAGDLNNDGWVDISTSGASDRVKVLWAQPYEHSFIAEQIDDARFFAQAANIVDANNDRWLDIHVCNDDGANFLYINDTMGGFYRETDLINFNTTPPSDNSGNYGSVWSDFDFDGDIDLYVSKCRVGVFDPTDPRRVNTLYVQTDTGYVEMADTFGIADGGQSWSADFADIDNDADFDMVIINHDVPSRIMENTGGGKYQDLTDSSQVNVSGLKIQSIFKDFDNDGLVDLLISGNEVYLYRNTGNFVFEAMADPFPGQQVSSFTVGDFNNDGFPDVYATYNELYNTPSQVHDDILWLNDGNNNNFVRVKLTGTTCNNSAVGSKLLLYTPDGVQLREVRAGESYGIGTSLIQTFGLGQQDEVDSLVILWADRQKEVYTDVAINQTLYALQGECLTRIMEFGIGPYVQCGTDTFQVDAPDGYKYLWSNGDTTRSTQIFDPGIYHVSLTDDEGCVTIMGPVQISPNLESPDDTITVIGVYTKCFGDSITLIAPQGNGFQWSDGSTGQVIRAKESGMYTVTVDRTCNDLTTPPVDINLLNPNAMATTNDTLNEPGSGTLTADGASVVWFDSPGAVDPVGTGNVFVTPVVSMTTTYYAQNTLGYPGENVRVGMPGFVGGTMYNGPQFNGGLIFDVFDACTLDSIMVYTEFEGPRTFEIHDAIGTVLQSRTLQVDSGMQVVPVDFRLEPGVDLLLTTNTDSNMAEFNRAGPYLARSDEAVLYPYTIDNVISIKDTPLGQQYYYYFFDWHITTDSSFCVGDRLPVSVVIDTSTAVSYANRQDLRLFPNPVSDALYVEGINGFTLSTINTYRIRTLGGMLVGGGNFQPGQPITVQNLTPGMYLFEAVSESEIQVARFVVSRP